MEETENYKSEYQSARFYKELIDTRTTAHHVLTRYGSTPNNTKKKAELGLTFKKHVNFLALELEAMFQEREDVDKPDVLKDIQFISPQNFTVNDGRVLMRSFRDLMQKLGITSMTKKQYELKPKGAVKKE